ncbi:hypothetical protein JHN63_50765, partial [Streptomyces sp. MBT65]|nr:hypothetical protein [Streptomyces sp. MBT65]
MSFGPSPAGFGPPAPPAWTPPTDTERALAEARARGDWTAYYDVLARVRLYYVMSRDAYDAQPDRVHRTFTRDPRTGTERWELFTDGMLPAPRPDLVYSRASLRWIADAWNPRCPPALVVNPGTPCE